jgi:glyoxylase-like metal-dependent hydrolase (beta-lactamase superfamily II)
MASLGIRPFERGLTDLGHGAWAWLQPDGSWGWSNAGLVTSGREALLVDTLFDEVLTAEMLTAMRRAVPRTRFGKLVNTHSNGDHCNGNALLPDAEIYASQATADELAHENPAMMAALLERAPGMGEVGEFFLECFSPFHFAGIAPTRPNRTFVGTLDVAVGEKTVHLRQVGPAHTRGDVIAHVPADRVVFTGDILFVEGHPIMWAGPVQNWIDACNYLLTLDVEAIVPGHGPVTDARGVRAVRDYLDYVRREAAKRHAAGLGAYEAALDISLADYDSWGDAERIVVNVAAIYRELDADPTPLDPLTLFGLMARIRKARR